MDDLLDFFNFNYKTYDRYWWQGDNRYLTDPKYHTSFNARILELAISLPNQGRVLDVGAGEGSQSIRMAKLGFQVDAVELTPVGCEKIEKEAKSQGVKINVINQDFLNADLENVYDIIMCNGVLHYTDHKDDFISKMKALTANDGFNIISSFTDFTPIPDCHKVVNVYPDAEKGFIFNAYSNEILDLVYQRNKVEKSHTEFNRHAHSFIKLISKKNLSKDSISQIQ